MPGPNVSVNRDLVNDYLYKIMACIDISFPDVEELKKARKLLLEVSSYIIQAPVKEANQKSLPSISCR